MARMVIIGDGGWGTALAVTLHGNGHRVRVWGPSSDYLDAVRARRENTKFLPGVLLPDRVEWVADRAEATDGADVAVLAVPSRFFGGVVSSFAPHLASTPRIVSVTKGLDAAAHERMTQVAGRLLNRRDVAALSGPSHAEEVARGIPTAVVLGCGDPAAAAELQAIFSAPAFRVYTSDDVTGVELGGALKNVIALAAGVSDGIGFGDNTKAALITRGLAEITRIGCAVGAHPATFAGLSGMGDLVVTCTSRHSRNRRVGERLGRGERIGDILADMEQVAEGVWTCRAARALARERNVAAPIIEEVCAVVHENKDPRQAVQSLLSREPRPERD